MLFTNAALITPGQLAASGRFAYPGSTGMTIAIASTCALILALLVMHTIDALDKLREKIMASQQSVVDAVVAQLAKSKAEIIAKLTDVQAQLEAAGVAEQVDLGPLVEIAQALDDVVPDVVPEDDSSAT